MFRRRFGYSGKRQIERVVRSIAERKFLDSRQTCTANTTNRVDRSGSIYLLTQIDQGSTDSERIGDKVTGTSLQLNLIAVNPGYVNDTEGGVQYMPLQSYFLRVLVFIWKDDTPPTPDSVLSNGVADSNFAGVTAMLDHDLKVKRKLIMDETFTLYSDTTSQITGTPEPVLSKPYGGSFKPHMLIKRSFDLTKLRNRLNVINYSGGQATDGINSIYILLISNAALDTTPTPDLNTCWNVHFNTRYNYIDM